MATIDIERFRTLLLEERGRVERSLERLHSEHPGSLEDETGELVSSSADNHLADTASETFERELDEGLGESAEQVLAEIDRALERIEDGTYGTCTRCGKPIEPDRLEVIPYATLCIEDKRRDERG